MKKKTNPADIQYVGIAGSTQDCRDAIGRLIQYGNSISIAKLLSCKGKYVTDHAFFLIVDGDHVAVKSGFSSGYGGEGPRGLSYILGLLESHGAEIDEYSVDAAFMERLDCSALTTGDITRLEKVHPIRPSRWSDYVYETDWGAKNLGVLWGRLPQILPLSLIEDRITDLAIGFLEDPDHKLLTGYRRLEDIIRTRTNLQKHGANLFQDTFLGSNAKLTWPKIEASEQAGRGQLFVAAYMTFRNPRAHKESRADSADQIREFLVLNQLYFLEKEAEISHPKRVA